MQLATKPAGSPISFKYCWTCDGMQCLPQQLEKGRWEERRFTLS